VSCTEGKQQDGLYKLCLAALQAYGNKASCFEDKGSMADNTSTVLNNVHLMHAHLGHTSVSTSHIHDTDSTDYRKLQFEIYTLAKFLRLPFPVSSSIATALFDLCHISFTLNCGVPVRS